MKIIERYPPELRLLRGRGICKVFRPVLWIASLVYSLWLKWVEIRATGAGTDSGAKIQVSNRDNPMVVSIGNIEVGGGGKTPCTLKLAEMLGMEGCRPVVVTRGYRGVMENHGPVAVRGEAGQGGSSIGIHRWDPDRKEGYREYNTAEAAGLLGDEVLIYISRGINVVVGKDRVADMELGGRIFDPTHYLLDDAFQNRKLEKDYDILLMDYRKPLGDGNLLPLGSLREMPEAVSRADSVIFTRAEGSEIPPEVKEFVEDKEIFFSEHRPYGLIINDEVREELDLLAGREVALFSGIARPGSFERLMKRLNAERTFSFRFRDHHIYVRNDIEYMISETGGKLPFVTTEKDRVKTAHLFPDEISLMGLVIDMEIREGSKLIEAIR